MHAKETVCHTCGAEEPTPQAILASVPSGQSGGPGMARACICIWAREGGSSSDWLMPGGEGFQGMLMWQKKNIPDRFCVPVTCGPRVRSRGLVNTSPGLHLLQQA
jgi:hypothetical protein